MPVPRLNRPTQPPMDQRAAAQDSIPPGPATRSAAPKGFDYAWATAAGGTLTGAQRPADSSHRSPVSW